MILRPFLALSLFLAGITATRAADISPDDQKFLTAYVHVHDALVTGNLAAVKKAAGDLPADSSAALAKASSLDSARDEFSKLATRAEKLAAGQPAYHIFYCPMAKKDWVQTGTAVANPYLGADMLTCGVEKIPPK